MKSAYILLGLPGDATAEEIRQALAAAEARFTKEHLVEHPEDIQRLQSMRDAARILLNPEMRAAHDRKLMASAATQTLSMRYVTEPAKPSWFQRPMLVVVLLVAGLFSAGAYLQHKNEQRKRELAALELEKRKLEEHEAQQKRADQARHDAMVARLNDTAKANEDRLRHESLLAARNAEYQNSMSANQLTQKTWMERSEALRKESAEKNAKYQAQMEVQRNMAIDQQRIRNLCLQNYGRPNC